MNAPKIFLLVIVSLALTGFARAEEKKIDVTFDLTYMSKYMRKGSESYGQKGVLFETVSFDFWDSGFGASVKHRNSTSGGYVDKERFDYKLYYKNRLFEDQSYETKYKVSWEYKHRPGLARHKSNSQEWNFGFSWPKLLPCGAVPYYIAIYEYPAGSGYDKRYIAGWVHVFGLGYDLEVPQLAEPLYLSADFSYRDGLGGGSKDHDWSHATLGVSTKFKLADNLTFVPGLYHQISMDDSVCKRDVTYCKLSMKYKF